MTLDAYGSIVHEHMPMCMCRCIETEISQSFPFLFKTADAPQTFGHVWPQTVLPQTFMILTDVLFLL